MKHLSETKEKAKVSKYEIHFYKSGVWLDFWIVKGKKELLKAIDELESKGLDERIEIIKEIKK